MFTEYDIIFRHYYSKSSFRIFYFYKLQNFKVIIINFVGQRKRTYVYNINIGVSNTEKSGDLGIFFLFVFFYSKPLIFRHRERIYVNFNSSAGFYLRPKLSKLFLHLEPKLSLVLLKFSHFFSCFRF